MQRRGGGRRGWQGYGRAGSRGLGARFRSAHDRSRSRRPRDQKAAYSPTAPKATPSAVIKRDAISSMRTRRDVSPRRTYGVWVWVKGRNYRPARRQERQPQGRPRRTLLASIWPNMIEGRMYEIPVDTMAPEMPATRPRSVNFIASAVTAPTRPAERRARGGAAPRAASASRTVSLRGRSKKKKE